MQTYFSVMDFKKLKKKKYRDFLLKITLISKNYTIQAKFAPWENNYLQFVHCLYSI